jgi:hypothetical protein
MDDAESAIDAAASGDESVYDATQQSLVGAEELSVPGESALHQLCRWFHGCQLGARGAWLAGWLEMLLLLLLCQE